MCIRDRYTQQEKDAFALNTPLCRLGTVSDVAKAAVFLASEESSFITGQVLCVDGGEMGIRDRFYAVRPILC